MNLTKIDTPETFFRAIPLDAEENKAFRLELHTLLLKDKQFQDIFLAMCFEKPEIAFNSMFATYDPRRKPGYRNRLFILRPEQIKAVNQIKDAIDNQHHLIIDKSRDEGATELICSIYALYLILVPECYFIAASRVEDLVDNTSIRIENGKIFGDHIPIFHKILYKIAHAPLWLQNRITIDKKFKFIQNLENLSTIKGCATSESLSAGGRATAVLVDECARIIPKLASAIINSTHDVSDCFIINSTHWEWGSGHPYAKILRSNRWPVCILDWSDNPEKAEGLYCSPDLNEIKIIDKKYYLNKYPEIFKNYDLDKPFKYSDFELDLVTNFPEIKDLHFVADGGTKNYKKPRSLWFDKEEYERTDPRDVAQNILRVAEASADQVFNPESLEIINSLYIRKPDYFGEITFNSERINQVLKIEKVKFVEGGDKSSFKWWGKLEKGRPNQKHNYIVACDIGRGTGASNSTVQIFDVNNCEQVGEYACAYIDVSDFAEQVIAICKWVGGVLDPYLIWEANGVGDTFSKRIRNYGYYRVYTRTDEVSKTRKKKKQFGWWSTDGINGTKLLLLQQLSSSLNESIKEDKKHFYVIIHSLSLLNELMDFMFTPNRGSAGISSSIDETTGAKFAHGDRVIPLGLIGLAIKEQPKAVLSEQKIPKPGTFADRFEKWKLQQEQEKKHRRNYWY